MEIHGALVSEHYFHLSLRSRM